MRKLFLILFCIFFIPYVSAQQWNCDPERVFSQWLRSMAEDLKAGKNKVENATNIGNYGKNCPRLVSEDILEALSVSLENDPDIAVKEAAGKALLSIGTEPAIAKLKMAFKNSNRATHLAVLKVFIYGKKLDKPMILDAIKDPDLAIRMKVASACESSIFAEDLEILNALRTLVEDDPNLDVKKEALHTLTILAGYKEEVNDLATPAVIPKEIKECLEAIASSRDKNIKRAAVDKLIAMGKAAVQPAIWELLDITAHEDPDARYYTAMALKGLGDKTAICGLKSGIYYEEVPYVRSMMEDALKHLQSLPD